MDNMNVTYAKYIKNPNTDQNESVSCTIDGKTMCVPMDTSNRHYAAILDWVAEGNTIQDAD